MIFNKLRDFEYKIITNLFILNVVIHDVNRNEIKRLYHESVLLYNDILSLSVIINKLNNNPTSMLETNYDIYLEKIKYRCNTILGCELIIDKNEYYIDRITVKRLRTSARFKKNTFLNKKIRYYNNILINKRRC